MTPHKEDAGRTGHKRHDPYEAWCRENVSHDESAAFWKRWCETQWGMPNFNIMRQCILAVRAKATP